MQTDGSRAPERAQTERAPQRREHPPQRETRPRVCEASGKAELTSDVTRDTDDVIPTSRDIWTIVERPLAGARGYQKSKTQMTLV